MRLILSETSLAPGVSLGVPARIIQSLNLSALLSAVWRPLTAITVLFVVCYAQIMFLQAMIERF